MQSKKRFREIFLWDADWFMQLDNNEKLFWYYINDHCDNIGVWEPNLKLAQFHTSSIDVDQFFKRVNKGKVRLMKLPNNTWFLPRFVKFQYCKKNPLNPKSPSHKSYLELMVERDLLGWYKENFSDVLPEDLATLGFLETSNRPLLEPSKGNKDKDKDQDKDETTNKDTTPSSIKKGEDFSDVALIGSEDSK